MTGGRAAGAGEGGGEVGGSGAVANGGTGGTRSTAGEGGAAGRMAMGGRTTAGGAGAGGEAGVPAPVEPRLPVPCDAPFPTGFCFDSEPGDLIAQGRDIVGEGAESVTLSTGVRRGGVGFRLESDGEGWSASFTVPDPYQLHPGLFEGAGLPEVVSEPEPRMHITPLAGGCNDLTGRYSIEEFEADPFAGLRRFSLTFEAHCNGGPGDIRGVIHYQASGTLDETIIPDRTIPLEGWCSRVVPALGSDFAYSVDWIQGGLAKIDLENGDVLRVDTTEIPSDLCVDSARERLFVVSEDAALVTEYRLADLGFERSIPLGGSSQSSSSAEPRIYCAPDRLYVTDASIEPALFTVGDLDSTNATVLESGVVAVGKLAFNAADTALYYWHQDSGVGGPSTSVHRLLTANFSEVDETAPQLPNFVRDDPDVPVFLDEARSLLLVKNRVFDANDLSTIIQELPDEYGLVAGGVAVYAFDAESGLVASQAYVYALDGLEVVAPRLLSYSSDSFFDQRGRLWSLSEQTIRQVLVAQVIPVTK
jgi:hypothetical protein